MLDIKFIRENSDLIKKNTKNRQIQVDIDRFLYLDKKNRKIVREIDNLRAELKNGSKTKPTPSQIVEMKKLGDKIKKLEEKQDKIKGELTELHLQIPNLTHPSSPIGKDDSENVEVERVGEPTKFSFKPKDHVELGKELDLLDFKTASEVSGNGFYYAKNELVFLELALTRYAFDKLVKKGFEIFSTPDMAREFAMSGAGFNPRGNENDIYKIENEDLSLIATAEITLGGYLANKILNEEDLDIKYAGISQCFRKEAGAYGKESRGLYRVHQFSKVEMFIFSKPENSEKLHEEMLKIEKEIFIELGAPFRVVDICTGDLGSPAYRKYDLEAWMPMKNGWGEVTSCSNCTDYQARRLNIKYRTKDGKKKFVHTLNGTAVTSSRAILAIMENYQQQDGSIIIPKVLRQYMPSELKVIKKK